MTAAVVQCAPELLRELEGNLRGLDGELEGATGADFSDSGEVDGSYSRKLGEWNHTRDDIRTGLSRIADLVTAIREAFEDADRSLAGVLGGAAGAVFSSGGALGTPGRVTTPNRPGVVSLGPVRPSPTGRAAIVEAFYATTDDARANKDEIEITRLANGRWVVALPGVTDLSAGPAAWMSNPDSDRAHVEQTVGPAMFGGYDDYAQRVKIAMQRAGIRSGDDVMLLGHSAGAYAAMGLAGDRSFNRSGDGGGFHVNVTHVVAAGAETDWMDRAVPTETNVLVINNTDDKVFGTEDRLHADAALWRPGHVEHPFAGGWTWNGVKPDVGHHPDHYADELSSTDDPRVSQWLADAGAVYGGDGERFAVLVAPGDVR